MILFIALDLEACSCWCGCSCLPFRPVCSCKDTNTFLPWIFTVCVTLASDQQTIGSGLPVWTVVYVWHGDCRLSTGIFKIAVFKYQLSDYFPKALHSGQDGDTVEA